MNEVLQREYDFFMRMATLSEMEAVKLAPYQETDSRIKALFRQHLDDMENCKFWAQRMKEGYRIVKTDGAE